MTDQQDAPRPVRDREIATIANGMDITRGYTGPLLLPSDRVLRLRGGGDLSIYEQVLSEPQVHSTFRQRQLAVVSKEWVVEPASDRRADKKAAEFIRQQLQRVGWDRVTERMLFGVFYGFAVAELLYGIDNGQIVWNAIKVRNRRRFRFTPGGELRMLTFDNMLEGVELPPGKFWTFCTGADNDDEPYGLGLAHWCYWPALFKRNGVKFWLTFIEKFAAPTSIGRYDTSATDGERAKLLAAAQAIQTDAGIIVPKGMELDLLEAARSGTADYKALHDTMDATIAKVVLGQTASTQGTAGKLGNDDLQGDVRDDLIKADADLVCESLNLGPVTWLTRWNFADADPPRVYRVTEPPEDLDARAGRDEKVARLGFKPTLRHVQDTYGGEWTEKVAAPPEEDADTPPANFAAGDADPHVERIEDVLATEADPIIEQWVGEIRELVEHASSLDEVRDALLTKYADMPIDKLGEVMARAMAAGALAGHAAVREIARDV